MGLLTRLTDAWRRVGFGGIVNDLRWRLRTAVGGHSVLQLPKRAVAILRAHGVRGLLNRARFGARQLRHPTPHTEVAEQPPHPWTQSAAHMVSFAPYFDLSNADLSANHAVVQAFPERTRTVTSATWFLPYFHHALFGGIHTILRIMDLMTRLHAVEHRVVVMDSEVTHEELRSRISAVFPSLGAIDLVLVSGGAVPYDELPPTDIGVCTLWTTAFALARFNRVGAKYYMVQDFEPAFYPAGSMNGLTEATYRLGFAGIVNTPGLAETYRSYGNPAVGFTPAFELLPDTDRSSDRADPVRIVLYGRPSIDRNAFELVASACTQLKRAYGDDITIVSAGEEFDPDELGLGGIIENRGLLSTIEDVQQLYCESDIGICFMFSRHPSYQPFEYLAAGVAPVANVNPATEWFFRDGVNCLTVEPFPSVIAEAVSRLVEDTDLRSSIVQRGREDLAKQSWDREFERIWSFVAGSTP